MTMEFSVLIVDGSGGNWGVDIYDVSPSQGWETIGNLSSAGSSGWATVQLNIPSSPHDYFLDPSNSNEIRARVHTTNALQVIV